MCLWSSILLGLITKANSSMKKLFDTYNITSESCLKTLKEIRGSARVTTDNPEGTYDALNKYGTRSGPAGQRQEDGSCHWP